MKNPKREASGFTFKAGEGTRTLDNDVGNVVLYQLSYTRNANVPGGEQGGIVTNLSSV